MTDARTTIVCADGPHDGRTFIYGEPLPRVIVIADDRLRYHEYHRQPQSAVYRWQRTYRIPRTELPEQLGGEILCW